MIFINGEKVAEGRIEHTQPFAFGAETTDVGENLYTCVSDDYQHGKNRFTGKIHKVTVQVGRSNLSEEAQRAIEELRMNKACTSDCALRKRRHVRRSSALNPVGHDAGHAVDSWRHLPDGR